VAYLGELAVRIVFCGTPDYAVPSLRAIAADPRHELVAVVSQPDKPKGRSATPTPPPVVAAALEMNFPRERIFQPRSINRPKTLDALRALQPDILCVVAYGNLLKQEALALPRHLCLNAHGSLLPRHRGAAPIQAALIAGDAATGVSMMKMELGLDSGPVLFTRELPITADDTAGSLHDKLAELSARSFVEALMMIESGSYTLTPQDESRATYAAKLDKSSGTIDWNKPAAELERFIRAMTPWPGAWTTVAGEGQATLRLRIARAAVASGAHRAGGEGAVAGSGESAVIVVGCGSGALEIRAVQPEGKREMSVAEFLRGAGRKLQGRSAWK